MWMTAPSNAIRNNGDNMLYSIDTLQPITNIPHKQEFDIWRSRLSDEEYNNIVIDLNSRISEDEVHTSSWMPGAEWKGTVFNPIYEKACRGDVELSGKCFGLILWIVMMHRDEAWSFGRYEKDGIPIEGMTYFRIHLPR